MKRNFIYIALIIAVFSTFIVAQKTNTSLEKRWKTVQEFADKLLPESALKEVENILVQAK